MPVSLNNLNNQWFNQKQVDTDGNGSISREEMATYTNNAAQKPPSKQSWEEALAGKLIHSADNNGGQTFFDIVSSLDGQEGLSKNDLALLAQNDGNGTDVTGNDFNNLNTRQTQTPTYQQPTYRQPTYQQPTYQQPTYQQPQFQGNSETNFLQTLMQSVMQSFVQMFSFLGMGNLFQGKNS